MKKNLIIGISLACAAILASTTALTLTHNKTLTAKAGGNDRTLVWDENDSVTLDQYNDGRAEDGMMGFYCRNAAQLSGGFISAKKLFIHHQDDNGAASAPRYLGFSGSTVSSISISYKISSAENIMFRWSLLYTSTAINYDNEETRITKMALTPSEDVQTLTLAAGSNFIDEQASAKSSAYEVINIALESNNAFDIYSITVNYTCL